MLHDKRQCSACLREIRIVAKHVCVLAVACVSWYAGSAVHVLRMIVQIAECMYICSNMILYYTFPTDLYL